MSTTTHATTHPTTHATTHPTTQPATHPTTPIAGWTGWTRAARSPRAPYWLLLLGTGALYLIGLSRSGWANQFYAAAAEAGSKSWTAFWFGSLDSSNFITVDKPPASLWIMDVSVKIFGANSWAILVPQALEGVAAVAVLYAAVKRVSGPNAALLAGAALATTPVATLMFRFDNPDALLVLLMTAAAYATVRAVEVASVRWLMVAGALIGFAFLTKMLQSLLVLPGLAGAYLVAAPAPMRRRILHVLAGGGAMVVAAGWWIALVELWPTGSRPYIGGSTDNSVWQLVFGYNGVGRLTGGDNNGAVGGPGGVGGATTGGGFSSGQTGLFRMFGSEMGAQISWLIPAALVGLAAVIWLTARRSRTDTLRASVIVWGAWLLVTGLVFSFASGIIHSYYTVALAPAIAALVGIGAVELWRARSHDAARWAFAVFIGAGAVWTFILLGRIAWHPELRWIVLLTGVAAALAVLFQRFRAALVAPFVAVTLLLGPTAYAVQTASTAHTGALPTAGPTGAATGRFGAGPGGFPGGGPRGGSFPQRGAGGPAGGATAGTNRGGFGGAGGMRGGMGGGMGGLGGATTVSSGLRTALEAKASDYRWVAATTSDNYASSLELAAGEPVMALGGYNGTDDAISLASFEKLVADGEVHYYVADQQGFIGSTAANTSTAYAIEQWVSTTFTAKTVGNTTVYDLTAK